MYLRLKSRTTHFSAENRTFTKEEMTYLATVKSLHQISLKNGPITDDLVAIICTLPRLQYLDLSNTAITDEVLVHISKLNKLKVLILDQTSVNGSGFCHMAGHSALRVLWASYTDVDDEAIFQFLSNPKLTHLVAKNTRITAEGTLELAPLPRLQINGGEQLSGADVEAFEKEQRRYARRGKSLIEPDAAEQVKAEEALTKFFGAMEDWTRRMINNRGNRNDIYNRKYAGDIHVIADEFCTDKPVKTGRLNSFSFRMPSENTREQILSAEWYSKRQLYLYTRDSLSRYRYRLVKSGERWLIDRREILLDGWTNTYFE